MYRIGFIGWKLAARLGVPLVLRVSVLRDDDANVFIATSPDLRGLVAEAKTPNELIAAVYDCADMLLEDLLSAPVRPHPYIAWNGQAVAA